MREFSMAAIACVGLNHVLPPGLSECSAATGTRLQRLEPLAQSNDLTLENNDYT